MKILGWILIIAFILYTLLPVHYYTEDVVVEYPSKVIEYYTFDNGRMSVNKAELPDIRMEERTSQTWFC